VRGALEHKYPSARASEHRCSDEAVVARPHDYRVNGLHRD